MTRQNCKNCGEPYSFDNLVTPGRATMICAACSKKIYTHTGQMYFEAPLHQKNHSPAPISMGQGVSFVPIKSAHSTEAIPPASRPHADLPKSEGWQRAKAPTPTATLIKEVQVVTEQTEVLLSSTTEPLSKATLNGAEKTLYLAINIFSALLLASLFCFIIIMTANTSRLFNCAENTVTSLTFFALSAFFGIAGLGIAAIYKKVSLLSKK